MTTDHVEEELRQLFAQVMDLAPAQVHADLSQDSCASWTSLNHLMLISQIESRFDVMFTNPEITAMTSYGRLAQTLAQHRAPV